MRIDRLLSSVEPRSSRGRSVSGVRSARTVVPLPGPLLATAFALTVLVPSLPGIHEPRSGSISYRVESAPAALDARFADEEIALLEKLNRADREHLSTFPMLVVPDRWDGDELRYSPLPGYAPPLARKPRALVVHQPLQVFGAYEEGRLVRWGPVSTGRRDRPTPVGRFHLNWRARERRSTVDPEWLLTWVYNFHSERGLALHAYHLPGRPASHACVRLLERDARWIFGWGRGWILDPFTGVVLMPGTPLWILGQYDFDRPRPWLDPEDPHPSVDLRPDPDLLGSEAEEWEEVAPEPLPAFGSGEGDLDPGFPVQALGDPGVVPGNRGCR